MRPEVREVGFVPLPRHANARGCLFKMKEECQLAKNSGSVDINTPVDATDPVGFVVVMSIKNKRGSFTSLLASYLYISQLLYQLQQLRIIPQTRVASVSE